MTRKLPRTSRADAPPLLLFLLLIATGALGAAACAHGAAQTPRRAAAAHATPPIVSPHAPGQGAMPRPAQYIQNTNNAPLAPVPAGGVQVPAYPGPVAAQDGQWTMPGENLADWRYSALDQITTHNVGRLKLAWTFSTGTLHGNEAAPLVVGSTMYVVTPYPNIFYALNLKKHGALKWKFNPHPDPSSQGVACCDTVNRGAIYGYGNIYYNLLDDQTVAVNAKTGKMVWKTRLDTIEHGSTMTMAPILAKNHVIVGNSGGELGVHGWVAGLDARTGAIAWRGYSEGPDSQVLIGSGYHPYYSQFRGKNLGVSTWPPGDWRIGGGAGPAGGERRARGRARRAGDRCGGCAARSQGALAGPVYLAGVDGAGGSRAVLSAHVQPVVHHFGRHRHVGDAGDVVLPAAAAAGGGAAAGAVGGIVAAGGLTLAEQPHRRGGGDEGE